MGCSKTKSHQFSSVENNNKSGFRGWEYTQSGDYHRNLDFSWSYAPTYLNKNKHVSKVILGFPKEANILDVGCGEGVLVERFRSIGYNIVGVDLNYESEFVRLGNVLDMPFFTDESFDLVLFLDVFEHLAFAEQPEALQEINRILRNGGLLLASIPNQAHWNSRLRFVFKGNLDRADHEFNHIGERPLKENIQLIEKAGFSIEKKIGITLTVPFIYRRIICRWPERFLWLHNALDLIAHPSLSLLNLFWCKRNSV